MQLLDFNAIKRAQWMSQRKPYSVLFELTPRCNMNCIHCYLKNKHMCKQMTYDEIVEIIDLLYDIGILFITFTGGEILTREDFIDIYIYAKKKGFLIELFSNGYLFNDSIIEVLREYPPLLVDISIYGANERIYKKVTGIDGAFKKVIDNCIKLKEAGLRVSLKTPVIQPTLSELGRMKKLASDIDVPFVYTFDICSTIDRDICPKRLAVPISVALKYEFLDYYKQLETNTRLSLKEDKDRQDEISKLIENEYIYACNVALNSFVIDYEGNICPCMKLRHYGVKLTKLTFDDVWDGFKCFSEKKASETYVCKGCTARYYCDICPAEMDFLYGNEEVRPDSVCKVAHIRRDFYCGKATFDEAIKEASLFDNKTGGKMNEIYETPN